MVFGLVVVMVSGSGAYIAWGDVLYWKWRVWLVWGKGWVVVLGRNLFFVYCGSNTATSSFTMVDKPRDSILSLLSFRSYDINARIAIWICYSPRHLHLDCDLTGLRRFVGSVFRL